jgi:hypothetical protein
MKTLMFNTEESMQLGAVMTNKLKRSPRSLDDISKMLTECFGLKTNPEKMADFGFWTLNDVVDEYKLKRCTDPRFLQKIINDPKRDYNNYDKTGKYIEPQING